ncbi:hypothetical protein [Nesterenkonia pannonica]|uniref:hypothetical protein n=1 Tax=Nesterenkonia pannonica TaxID=1548602 RepID=UPI0021644ACA|nr:hypothetical protein [Nesterenkonia pannonica]
MAQAYVAHLEEQMNEHQGQLEDELEGAQTDRDEALEAATDDSEDLFAQQQLTQALTEVVSIESQTTFLEQAGPPAVLMEDAAPGRPLGTEPYLLLIIGAVCGLIVYAGAALLREQFDDRLRSSQAMESQTGKPLLAEVPAIRRRRGEATLPWPIPRPPRSTKASAACAPPFRWHTRSAAPPSSSPAPVPETANHSSSPTSRSPSHAADAASSWSAETCAAWGSRASSARSRRARASPKRSRTTTPPSRSSSA